MEESQRGINYRRAFFFGLILLAVAISTRIPGLWGLGILLMIYGFYNRSHWPEKKSAEIPAEKPEDST